MLAVLAVNRLSGTCFTVFCSGLVSQGDPGCPGIAARDVCRCPSLPQTWVVIELFFRIRFRWSQPVRADPLSQVTTGASMASRPIQHQASGFSGAQRRPAARVAWAGGPKI